MAAHNVCRYYKFGHCKFADKCRFVHIHDKCENSSCDIKSCSLRHPRICKFFRDYRRCKFGEWCSFDHIENSNEGTINNILEKIQNLEENIKAKDALIKELTEKIERMEQHFDDEMAESESVDGNEINTTFINPYLGKPCEKCDFIAKSKADLQIHIKAKHNENCESISKTNLEMESEDDVVDKEECDHCELESQQETALEIHNDKEHTNCEIKLEVFVLFINFEDDIHYVRKKLIEKLEEQDEVEKVLKVFINKNDAFVDDNDLKWHSVDVTLSSKHNTAQWKEAKFRKKIFQKCWLYDTFSDYLGEMSRKHIERRKEENRLSGMRSMGYLV